MVHYDHSISPASEDEGSTWTHEALARTRTNTHALPPPPLSSVFCADFHFICRCSVYESVGEVLKFIIAATHYIDVVGRSYVSYEPVLLEMDTWRSWSVFPAWSSLGTSRTGWVNVNIPDGHELLSWITPVADCSRGLHCWTETEELPAESTSRFQTRPEHSRTDLQWWSRHRVAHKTSTRSVPQPHRLQEGVLACFRVTGPTKLQHRGRTGLSHSGTVWVPTNTCELTPILPLPE